MTDGRGSVRAFRSLSRAVVSKMPKRTWQLNYKRISKNSCVSILRKARGELPEPARNIFWERPYVRTLIDSDSGACPSDGSGLSVMAPRTDPSSRLRLPGSESASRTSGARTLPTFTLWLLLDACAAIASRTLLTRPAASYRHTFD